MQVLASRETPPFGSGVVSIGVLQAGAGAFNVIPDSAMFAGRMRSLSHDHIMHLKERFAQVRGICVFIRVLVPDMTVQPTGLEKLLRHTQAQVLNRYEQLLWHLQCQHGMLLSRLRIESSSPEHALHFMHKLR